MAFIIHSNLILISHIAIYRIFIADPIDIFLLVNPFLPSTSNLASCLASVVLLAVTIVL